MKLTSENFVGPWAGLPVAWTEDDQLDEANFRLDVADCCKAGMPGVYTGGTTGEFYAQTEAEFAAIAAAAIEECHYHNTTVMIGCTATCTREAARRAAFAAEQGADAIQVALPFWMEVSDSEVVPFFRCVSDASGGLPLSIYETLRAKKALTLEQHEAVRNAIPDYLMVKANAGTIGATPDGCRRLSDLGLNVFVGEHLWAELGPHGAVGCCSAMVYWNPRLILELWQKLQRKDWQNVQQTCSKIKALHTFLVEAGFETRGFTDAAFDKLGGRAGGFLNCSLRCRAPYPSAQPADVQRLQDWYRQNFPEMLQL